MSTILLSMALSALGGCGKTPDPAPTPDPEHIEGGTTTRRDDDAPKEIASKELTGFSVNVYLQDRWSGEEDHFFEFLIEEDDAGKLIASEKNTGVSAEADEKLLSALQDVIDENELVKMNGLYDVTAGLPPEFQECFFTANYASGEKLYFTINNEPAAKWGIGIYDTFASWFSEQGNDALYPAKETSKISRIELTLTKNGTYYDYGGITVLEEDAIDGERYLLQKSIYNASDESKNEDQYILFPDDFYDRVTEIIAGTDLVRQYDFSYFQHSDGYYGMGDQPADEADSEDHLELYIEFENGNRISVDTGKASELEGFCPLTDALVEYYESLFE